MCIQKETVLFVLTKWISVSCAIFRLFQNLRTCPQAGRLRGRYWKSWKTSCVKKYNFPLPFQLGHDLMTRIRYCTSWAVYLMTHIQYCASLVRILGDRIGMQHSACSLFYWWNIPTYENRKVLVFFSMHLSWNLARKLLAGNKWPTCNGESLKHMSISGTPLALLHIPSAVQHDQHCQKLGQFPCSKLLFIGTLV
jgi:hypothetical protein